MFHVQLTDNCPDWGKDICVADLGNRSGNKPSRVFCRRDRCAIGGSCFSVVRLEVNRASALHMSKCNGVDVGQPVVDVLPLSCIDREVVLVGNTDRAGGIGQQADN